MSLLAAMQALTLVLAGAGSFTLIGYYEHASMKGWPSGAIMDKAWLKGAALLVFLVAIWKAWYLFTWWAALLVALAAVAVSFMGSVLLQWRIQIPAVIAMAIGGIAAFLFGAEVVR